MMVLALCAPYIVIFLVAYLTQEHIHIFIYKSVFDAHSLHFGVELKRVLEPLPAYPRHLGATKGHIKITQQPTIHPHSANL